MMLDRGMGLLLPGTYDQYRTSDQRVVYGYVFAKRSITAGSSRANAHTMAALGDTQQVTITNTTVSATYGTTLKSGDRNLFSREDILAHDLLSAAIAINNSIEAACAAYLSTYKTQYNSASTGYSKFGEWNNTDYCWIVPKEAEKWFFQYIQEVMAINDYDMPLDLVCDPAAFALSEQLRTQGNANETNLGWQLDNLTIVKSRRVADTNYAATVYAIPRGTVGMVNRIPSVNRMGFSGKDVTYSNMSDPLGTGLEEAVHYYESAYDGSAAGSETQDLKFEYENSTDYGLVKAPISDGANYSPIFKFVLLN